MSTANDYMILLRFKQLVHDKLLRDFPEDYRYINLDKVNQLIDSGATLKQIMVAVREHIVTEVLKERNGSTRPGST